MREQGTENSAAVHDAVSVVEIQGVAIQVTFAEAQNTQAATVVRDILKNSYLQRCGA